MRKFFALCFTLLCTTGLAAQNPDFFDFFDFPRPTPRTRTSPRTAFCWDVLFQSYFDNRENGASDGRFSPSQTLYAARLTPLAGVRISQNSRLDHRLMVGTDIMKRMGENPTDDSEAALQNRALFRELLLYYQLDLALPHGRFQGYAGVFPRLLADGTFPTAFLSDSVAFFDNNIEGMLLQYRAPKGRAEVGLDWTGMYGKTRREHFVIFSDGELQLKNWLKTGYTLTAHHFANSMTQKGVVDNILAEPYVTAGRFGERSLCSLTLGWLQAIQQDRIHRTGLLWPGGLHLRGDLRYRAWGGSFQGYAGRSVLPFYDTRTDDGPAYGASLYWGDPFYRLHRDPAKSWSDPGLYLRQEVFWQPALSSLLDIRLSLVFHETGDGGLQFGGWQQKFSLLFHLDAPDRKRPVQKTALRPYPVDKYL